MSALLAHVKALRALASGYALEAGEAADLGDETTAELLKWHGEAHRRAANVLEEQMRKETTSDV